MSNEQPQIHELILEGFHNSVAFLTEFFGQDKPNEVDMVNYVKVISALRGMPRAAMDEVVHPILTAQFKAFGLDPTDAADRAKGAEIADLLALSVQDAMAMIMQIMQQQQANAAKIMSGQGNLIRG